MFSNRSKGDPLAERMAKIVSVPEMMISASDIIFATTEMNAFMSWTAVWVSEMIIPMTNTVVKIVCRNNVNILR
jgi:hypothetical protein